MGSHDATCNNQQGAKKKVQKGGVGECDRGGGSEMINGAELKEFQRAFVSKRATEGG